MRVDRFTQKMQEALQTAQDSASQEGHSEITNEHFLLALLSQTDGVVPPLLEKMGVPVARLTEDLRADLNSRPRVSGGSVEVRISNELRTVLDSAEREMTRLKDEFVSAE